jgi:hypothetical protein
MKKFSLEKLIEALEACEKKLKEETSPEKRDVLSRAYSNLSAIIKEAKESCNQ